MVARKTAQVPLQKGVVIWIWFPFPGALTQSPPLLPSSSPQPNSFSLSTLPRITSTTSTSSTIQLATAELVFSLPCLASLLPVPNPPSLSFSPPTPRGRHPRGMLLPSRRPRVPHVPPPRTTRAATAFLAEPVGTARRHRHTCHPLISHNAARPLCSFSLQDSLFPLPLQPITPSHLLGSADHTHTERAAGSARIARRRKP